MNIPQSILQLLPHSNLSTFFNVEIMFDTPWYHTTFYRDISCKYGTFSADNTLMGVDTLRASKTVDREVYKVQYSDPTFALRSLVEAGVAGRKVSVWIGFINTLDIAVGGKAPGEVLDDYILVYSGYIDSTIMAMQDDTHTVTFECASPMAGLDVDKLHFTSVAYLKDIDKTDTSFDQVYDGSRSITLLWGKKK